MRPDAPPAADLSRPAGPLRGPAGLVVFLFLSFGVAALGSIFTTPEIPGWYQTLRKPDWTPPAWLFGPVWTLLFLAMAVAAWRVWRRAGPDRAEGPLALFGVQLVLNALWSGLFFRLHRPDLALLDIAALWAAILATGVAFWRRDRVAGLLFAPYLMWVSYAAALNAAIWRMNG